MDDEMSPSLENFIVNDIVDRIISMYNLEILNTILNIFNSFDNYIKFIMETENLQVHH